MMNAMTMYSGSGEPTRRLMMRMTVNQPAIRLYHEWRHLTRSHTAARSNGGFSTLTTQRTTIRVPRIATTGLLVAGEAELSLEIPGLLIAWTSRAVHGAVQNGEVWFSSLPADRSEVRLILTWQSGERVQEGAGEAGETAVQVERELRRFKQLMEQ